MADEAATAYLGLGSNVGDRLETIESCIWALHESPGIAVEDLSGVYETAPWGGVAQAPFLNAVVKVRTTLAPRDLLRECQLTEAAYGRDRVREERWGPRPLDIDILLYGDEIVDEPDLTIPHPRLTERAFVLVPLMEVMPGGSLPDGTRVTAALSALMPVEGIELFVRLTDVPGGPRLTRPEGPPSPGAFRADEWSSPPGPPRDVDR